MEDRNRRKDYFSLGFSVSFRCSYFNSSFWNNVILYQSCNNNTKSFENTLPQELIFYIIKQYSYQNQEINIDTVLVTNLQTLFRFLNCPSNIFFSGPGFSPGLHVSLNCCACFVSFNLGQSLSFSVFHNLDNFEEYWSVILQNLLQSGFV